MQLRAAVCGRLTQHDKCCIMLACTHLLGSCHQQRQDKERCKVLAHCTNCEICADNRCLVYTLAYVGILLLSSSLSLSPSLSASPARRGESTNARAHFDNREQCTCSRGLVYALSYIGSFGTVCPSVVSCNLYQSSGTSRGSLPHCRVPALCHLIKMQLSNVPVAFHSPM